MKSLIIVLVFALLVSSAFGAFLRPRTTALAVTPIQEGKSINDTQICVGGDDCSSFYSFTMSSVTFRVSDRTVTFGLTYLRADCGFEACPDLTASNGIRLLVVNSSKANLTAFVPNKQVTQQVELTAEVGYIIQINAPQIPDLISYSYIVQAQWPTDTPAWVIVVLVAGSVLVLALLIAIAYCLYMRLCHKSSEYERFE